ncbi:MAG: METTL5 family protein [Thermoplasmata archaeon]|nr:METTL5 family protein [Staphylococcus epidermidis]
MDKKELELKIESLEKIEKKNPLLEQYETPANIVADIIFIAIDDIKGKVVADLGCGNGSFSLGAYLIGAKEVHCVEIDEDVINIAKRNLKDMNVKFHNINVMDFNIKVDTVLMNPPFGYQLPGADRYFIMKALEISNTIYTLHHKEAIKYIKKFIKNKGEIVLEKDYKFKIPYSFKFHEMNIKEIDAKLIKIKVKKYG